MDRPFNLLDYSSAFCTPRRLTNVDCWHLHIPFAFVITAMLKPKKFVELGTHKGDSYCAFCQAVDESALNTVCYAVDSWQGDEQAGFYGAEVLEELRAYHDPLYGGFSNLMKCLFDDAMNQFSEGSIDLLHIDGRHTYDSVRHDFESWLPKMSERGIMLFHDSNVREREFGVWRLWAEISSRYPSFEFKFGHGLGVLAVGVQIEEEVQALLEYGRDQETDVSRFFYHLGTTIERDLQESKLSEQVCQLENMLLDRDKRLEQAGQWLREHQTSIREKELQIIRLKQERDTQLQQIEAFQGQIGEKNRQLDELHASKGWRWLTRYRKIKSLLD
jgi:hypothetical protein